MLILLISNHKEDVKSYLGPWIPAASGTNRLNKPIKKSSFLTGSKLDPSEAVLDIKAAPLRGRALHLLLGGRLRSVFKRLGLGSAVTAAGTGNLSCPKQ